MRSHENVGLLEILVLYKARLLLQFRYTRDPHDCQDFAMPAQVATTATYDM